MTLDSKEKTPTTEQDPITEKFIECAERNLEFYLGLRSLQVGEGGESRAHQLHNQGMVGIIPRSGLETSSTKKTPEITAPFIQSFKFDKDGRKVAIQGTNLRAYLEKLKKSGKTLADETAIEIALQVLIGLYFLQENEVVHLDLKSDNILVLKENPIVIQIIDLPDNKLNPKDNSVSGHIASTVTILPPEAISRDSSSKHVPNFDYIEKNPLKISWYAFHKFLNDLMEYTPKQFSKKSLLNAISQKAKKSKTKISLEDLDSKAWGLKKDVFKPPMDKKELDTFDFNPKCRELIARYQDTLAELEKGVYTNQRDDPLQTAPASIRDIHADYVSLKERLALFFDDELELETSPLLLNKIKSLYEGLNSASQRAKQQELTFIPALDMLRAKLQSHLADDTASFLKTTLELMKKIQSFYPTYVQINRLEENIAKLERNIPKEDLEKKESGSLFLAKLTRFRTDLKLLNSNRDNMKENFSSQITKLTEKFEELEHSIKNRCLKLLNSMLNTWFSETPAPKVKSSQVIGLAGFFDNLKLGNGKELEKIIEIAKDDAVTELKDKKGLLLMQ